MQLADVVFCHVAWCEWCQPGRGWMTSLAAQQAESIEEAISKTNYWSKFCKKFHIIRGKCKWLKHTAPGSVHNRLTVRSGGCCQQHSGHVNSCPSSGQCARPGHCTRQPPHDVCLSQLGMLFSVLPASSTQTIRPFLDHRRCQEWRHLQAFVSLCIDYCNSLFYGISDGFVQNTAAHLVTGTWRRDHISPVLRQLRWLPVHQHIEFKMAILIYKSLHVIASKGRVRTLSAPTSVAVNWRHHGPRTCAAVNVYRRTRIASFFRWEDRRSP